MKTMFLRLFMALFLIVVVSPLAFSMIREVSLNKLVHSSSVIVVADVEQIKHIGKDESDIMIIANLLKIEDSIKGNLQPESKIKVKTYGGVSDLPTFRVGSKLLLFLLDKGTYYEVNYAIQGCWPIRNGKLQGMGLGKTISDVKKEMAAPPEPEAKGKPFLL